jgi:hypothetical protein
VGSTLTPLAAPSGAPRRLPNPTANPDAESRYREPVHSQAQSPDEYVASLPEERRDAVSAVRDVILRNLPAGYEEGTSHGMIAYYVPVERFPDTYNGEPLGLAGIASQKQYVSVYLLSVYGDPETERWFQRRYEASGKRLSMGKSCLRFRNLEDVALDVIGETIARADLDTFLDRYRAVRGSARLARRARST